LQNEIEREKAKNEFVLHWRASRKCPNIVKVVDIYRHEANAHKAYLLVMEQYDSFWFGYQESAETNSLNYSVWRLSMAGGRLFDRLNELATTNSPLTERSECKTINLDLIVKLKFSELILKQA
jgi:hypothetical protein